MLRKTLLAVLLATTATLVSAPGAAKAQSPESVSGEQVNAAVQRILAKRHSAEDLALVKSVPAVARYLPDPNGPSVTVTTVRRSVAAEPSTAAGTSVAGAHPDGGSVAAAETCGVSTVDLQQTSTLGATIYKWRHQVLWCDDRVNVTRILSRTNELLQIDPLAEYLELTGDVQGATPRAWTTSYYQRHIKWCTPTFPSGAIVCYNMYPWSRIFMYASGQWTFRYGDAAG